MAHPRQARQSLVAAGLVTALAVSLTGCTADARVPVVEEQIQATASRATPLMIGVLAPDVRKVLDAAGDQTSVMMPILAPDLSTATATITAQASSTELFQTADDAAAVLSVDGLSAWMDWIAANPDAVGYVETSVPVRVSPKGETLSASVDEDALRLFAGPLEQANLELFMSTAEAMPQWQRTMVVVHAWDFLPQVTGLSPALASTASLDSVEPAGDGRFLVSVRHLDAKAAILAQVQKALESYGEGKIWGKVTKSDFEARMETVTDVSADEVTTQATVTVSTTDPGIYLLTQSLAENLAAQSYRYRVEAEPGSFPMPEDLDQLRADAIEKALAELAKRTIAEEKRPGTTTLIAGKSGSQITIRNAGKTDKHIAFFKWKTKKQVVSVFIKAGKTLRFRIPPGSYKIVYAYGEDWYGKKRSFGPTGQFVEFKNAAGTGPMKYKILRNYLYTMTLEGKSAGESSVGSGSTDNPFEE